MSHYEDRNLLALDHVEDLLEAYAEARLTPPGALMARMRIAARVAADQILPVPQAALPPEAYQKPRFGGLLPTLRRYGFAMGATAMLTLATGAAVLAAPPGSPFYETRMALEVALLPAQADARLAAHVQHLEERVAEAQAAAGAGDRTALDAALAAYQVEVDAVVIDVGSDATRLARLEAVLAKHTAVLTALLAKVPEQAAIEHAIASSQKASAKLQERGGRGSGGTSHGPRARDGEQDRPADIPTPDDGGADQGDGVSQGDEGDRGGN